MKQCDYFSNDFLSKIWPYFSNHYTKSAKSLENVYHSLRRLCEFLQKEPFEVTGSDAERYKEYLLNKTGNGDLKISYVMASVSQIKSFYRFIGMHKFQLNGLVDLSYTDPFQYVFINEQTKNELTYRDFPSMKEVDKLLSYLKEHNYMLYTAVVLAYKMGLSIDEISKLKKNAIVKNTTNFYISFENRSYAEDNRYLLLTNDIEKIIFTAISYSSSPFIYVLCYKNKQYTVRSMQYHLSNACKEVGVHNITFSSLRNAALCMMIQNNCPPEKVAKHAGLEGRWMCRFEKVDEALVSDAATYVNFLII